KSSTLEAIFGMSFPAKDNLCTRFATELILRRALIANVNIRITPGPERSDEEKARLRDFTYSGTLADLDISYVINDVKSAMDLNGSNKVFSTNVLCIEISGPSQPYLTIVDLLGFFLAGNKDQSNEDAALVEALMLSYIKKLCTIILVVISAKSNFALQ
ncbi:P-loop containing nucleoside triphosphate hydrolase protein, partial [Diplogelasinospora grovesii]